MGRLRTVRAAARVARPRRAAGGGDPARLALVGRPWAVDALAAALLAGGGDRQALVPLRAPSPRSCAARAP